MALFELMIVQISLGGICYCKFATKGLPISAYMILKCLVDFLGGGFKYFFICTPIWGRFPFGLIFFKEAGRPPECNFLLIYEIEISQDITNFHHHIKT